MIRFIRIEKKAASDVEAAFVVFVFFRDKLLFQLSS